MSGIPTEVDRTAPVLAHHELEIEAPLERVWRLHTDVAGWPQWQKEVTEARIDGPFEPGTSFDWTSYGFSVTSRIYEVDERSARSGAGPPTGSPGSTNGASPRRRPASGWRSAKRKRADGHGAAVKNEALAGDVRRERRGEKDDRFGDLRRRARAT